jgi:ribonuclease P protein component
VTSRWTFKDPDRIRKRSEYQRVYDQGRKIFSKSFTLFYLENTLGRPRLGITATRRAGGAVQRNRAKRVLREWFRLGREGLPSLDLVFNVRAGLGLLEREALSLELTQAIRRLSQHGGKS